MNQSLSVFIKKCLWPNTFFGKLGVALGGLSLLGLIIHSVQFGTSKTVLLIIQWYNKFLDIVLGWLTKPLEVFFEFILQLFNIPISLGDHWQHIFVILNIYFFRNAFSYSRGNKISHPNRHANIFLIILALIMSSTIASATGMATGNNIYNFLFIAVFPLLGILLYDIIERVWNVTFHAKPDAYSKFEMNKKEALSFYLLKAFERFLICVLIGSIGTSLTYLLMPSTVINPGIIGFLAAVLLMSLYWIAGRASLNFQHMKNSNPDQPLLLRLMEHSGTTYLGQMMLGTFFWLIVFVITNAGLSSLGL